MQCAYGLCKHYLKSQFAQKKTSSLLDRGSGYGLRAWIPEQQSDG